MLGINVADAVTIVGLALALLAALSGNKSAGTALKTAPPDPTTSILGATLVDTDTFRDVAAALKDLTKAVREAIDDRREGEQDRMTELLEEISVKLDQQPPKPQRGPRRGRAR